MMRKTFSAVVFLVSILALGQAPTAAGGATAARVVTDPQQITSKSKLDIQPVTVEKLFRTNNIGENTWSNNGKQIGFIGNMSGRYNVWIVSAESGWPTQLTISDQRQISPVWSPNGRWIAYASDLDGNELWDVYLVSPTSGQVLNLTNTPEIAEVGFSWSPNSEKLVYSSKPKDSPNWEIDLMEVLTKQVTHVTSNTPKELSNIGAIWSKDGKSIIFTQENASGRDSNVFVADLKTGRLTNLTPHQGEQTFEVSDISPDGKTVLVTSNAENGYRNAALVDVATKKISWLTNQKWEITAGKFSPDGKRLTWTSNIDGDVDIFIYELSTRQADKLPLPTGVNTLAGAETAFSSDGRRLLYSHEGGNAPNDLWVYDFATQKSHQVTHSLSGGVRAENMVEPFLVHYPSKDGKYQISALLYVPFNAERNGKNAAVVFIHGGPETQIQNVFIRSIQYLVNQGFFVIAPNYRGSSGYGKEFEQANRFDMGGGDLQDVVAAADWLAKTGYVDAKKTAVFGGSYGGYLSMMAATKVPERWAAVVAWVPFVNWFTEIENTDPAGREYALANIGDPMKDKTRLQERSPIYFVDQVKAPVLLLAGGKDPRCPPTEAEQVASAIKKRGGNVDLKIYGNEGHGFARLENQIDALTRVAEFLKKYVPPEKCGCNLYE
jgi:dipeptidyl aminopeptidase/acylaminoacyl peptidase